MFQIYPLLSQQLALVSATCVSRLEMEISPMGGAEIVPTTFARCGDIKEAKAASLILSLSTLDRLVVSIDLVELSHCVQSSQI